LKKYRSLHLSHYIGFRNGCDGLVPTSAVVEIVGRPEYLKAFALAPLR
jgi:hypothetical protein